MTEFTEVPQETREVPQETKEVAEARQAVDRATFEPEAAVERSADIKTAEAVEAAVKEAVEAAVPTADGGRETGDREVAADTATEDGGRKTEEAAEAADRRPETEDRGVAADAATEDGGRGTEDAEGAVGTATEDGGQSYEFRTDSQTEAQAVEDRIESVEDAQDSLGERSETFTQRESVETISSEKSQREETTDGQPGDDPQRTASPALEAEKTGEEISPNAVKAVGGTSADGSELPVDDDGTESAEVEGEFTFPSATTSASLAEGLAQVREAETSGSPETGRVTVDAPSSSAETVMIDTVPLPESPAPEASGLPGDEDSGEEPDQMDEVNQQLSDMRDKLEDLKNKVSSQAENTAGAEADGVWEMAGDGSTSTSALDEIIENKETVGERFQPPEAEIEDPSSTTLVGVDGDSADAIGGVRAAETQDEMEGLKDQLSEIMEAIQAALKQLQHFGEELKNRRDEIKAIRDQITELTAEIGQILNFIPELREENSYLADCLGDLAEGDTIQVTVRATTDPAASDYSWSEETVTMDREMIEARISDNEDLISILQDRISTLEMMIEDQHRKIEDNEKQISEIIEDMEKLGDQINEMQQEAAALSELLRQEYSSEPVPKLPEEQSAGSATTTNSTAVTGSSGSPPADSLPMDD